MVFLLVVIKAYVGTDDVMFLHVNQVILNTMCFREYITTAKPVYKGHWGNPDKPGQDYKYYSLMGKMRLPFIDNDLLYRGAL